MAKKIITGYPSIDKPWLKYYSDEEINAEIPQGTIYNQIYENNIKFPHDIALLYFGKRITYKTMFKKTEHVAKVLVSYGVKDGDNVAVCMPALPETIYLILALNKVGANAVLLNCVLHSYRAGKQK